MILVSLKLWQFRNYVDREFEFSEDVNVIYGYNGQGKTNLLEAISYLCVTKSFRTNSDAEAIPFHSNFFKISGRFHFDQGIRKEVVVRFVQGEGKRIFLDGSRVTSAADLVGIFPVVILTPEHEAITYGGPAERRRFLDFILSQTDKFYLNAVQKYRRVLRQRNKILAEAQERRFGFQERIAPWNRELFELGNQITEKRQKFLAEFQRVFRPIFQELTLKQEDITITYAPSFAPKFREWGRFESELEKIQNIEILRGTTLLGPHRDEITFLNNGWDLRKFGSRGQHRTAVIALKIAEFFYVYKTRDERPIFLLDDVYTEIDKVREKNLTDYFTQLGQIFLTTSDVDLKIDSGLEKERKISYYSIDNPRGLPRTEKELEK